MSRAISFAGRYLYAWGGFVYLFSGGFLRPKHRRLINSVCRHFGLRTGEPLSLPTARLEDFIEPSVSVRILEPEGVVGNVSLQELYFLNHLVAEGKPEAIFEFGTFDGRTTLNLAANSPDASRVYTLDLPQASLNSTSLNLAKGDEVFIEKERSGSRFQGSPWQRKVEQLYGDSATFDFSPYYGKMDIIFVDASHSYDYVLNDSRTARRLLGSASGIIVWHDYGVWDGVTRALNELQEQDPAFRGLRRVEGTSLAILAA